jgi:hypothetical protein
MSDTEFNSESDFLSLPRRPLPLSPVVTLPPSPAEDNIFEDKASGGKTLRGRGGGGVRRGRVGRVSVGRGAPRGGCDEKGSDGQRDTSDNMERGAQRERREGKSRGGGRGKRKTEAPVKKTAEKRTVKVMKTSQKPLPSVLNIFDRQLEAS